MLHGTFRWKPILILVGCFALLSAGWFFLHKFQMKSIHGRFLAQATRAEEANPPQYDRALRFLRVYLLAKKDDANALARYGILLEDRSNRSYQTRNDALGIYELVLAQDPTRKDILMRAAKLSFGLGRVNDAVTYFETLKRIDSNDSSIDVFLGDCKQEQARRESKKDKQNSQWKEAEKLYRAAILLAPHNPDAYFRLAVLLRDKLKSPFQAVQVLDELVRANSKSALAYIIRAEFRQTGGDEAAQDFAVLCTNILGLMGSPSLSQGPYLSASTLLAPETARGLLGADQDLSNARALAPDDAMVLLASAGQELLLAQQKGQTEPKSHLDKARGYLERGERLHPLDTRFLSQLATVERSAGNQEKAMFYLRTAQAKASGDERNRLLWDLTSILIDGDLTKNLKEAQDMIDQMRKNRMESHRLDFLNARIMVRQSQWNDAAKLLQAARPMLAKYPALVMQTDLYLGLCFEQLGNSDQQVSSYQRARQLDPSNPAPRYRLAMALASVGQLDRAIQELEEMRATPQHTVAAELLYARLMIIKNLKLPEAERNWTAVDEILTGLEKQDDSVQREGEFLRAEVALVQGNQLYARYIFEEARSKWPKSVAFWIALASLEPPPQGSKILDQAFSKFPDSPEIRLARLHPRYLPEKKEEVSAYLRPLSENLEQFDRSNQARLLASLAEAYERASVLSEAERLWKKLVEIEPNQLPIRLVLFDFYRRTKNTDGMERVLASVKKIEGADQPFGNYGQAQIELFRAGERMSGLGKPMEKLTQQDKQLTPAEQESLNKARGLLYAAQAKRPKWSRIEVSLAAIAEMEGHSDLMITHLIRAVDFGNREPTVIRALNRKLLERGRRLEADAVVGKLLESGPLGDITLQKEAAEISVRDHADRAVKLAMEAVPKGSEDFEDYLWLGQILAAGNLPEKAEVSLRTSIKYAKGEPSPRVALIQLLQIRIGDSKKAAVELEELKAKVDADKLPLALASCYQIMGDLDKAQKAFVEARKVEPKSINVLKSAATFYLGLGKLKDAEDSLRQMLDTKAEISEEDRFWARRNLAMTLWFQEPAEKKTEAAELIEKNLHLKTTTIEDQMVKAMMLAAKSESRPEAIKILEKAYSLRQPTADQMFVLADLYDANGEWLKCRRVMLELVIANSKHEKYQRFVSALVDKLMIHDEVRDAELWLDRLQESIRGELEQYRDDHLKRPQSELFASRFALDTYLLTELGRRHPRLTSKIRASGTMLKSFAAETGKKESLLVSAEFLASCQDLEESLDLCAKVLDLPPQQVLAIAVTAVTTNEASTKQIERVEGWLMSARLQKPVLREADVYLAALKERQADYKEAEKYYRVALMQSPDNLMVLNNLAFLIGLQGKKHEDEANSFIKIAIEKTKGAGEILDSRAAIYRVQGRLAEAKSDIQEALRQQKTPYRLFHLAQILKDEGNTQDSMKTFEDAEKRGLRIEMLHPLEVESFRAFEKLKKES